MRVLYITRLILAASAWLLPQDGSTSKIGNHGAFKPHQGLQRGVGSAGWWLAGLLLIVAPSAHGQPLTVAVASNFIAPLEVIAQRFTAASGHAVDIVSASTGKLYAQIIHGAPYDVFLAADAASAQLLESRGLAREGSRATYAIGRLALWTPNAQENTPVLDLLKVGKFSHLAIANPRHAPYGRAARQVLQKMQLWEELSARTVRGENIAQTYQFVESGHAELGFVARSQLVARPSDTAGDHWDVPESFHDPVWQQLVVLTDAPGSEKFADFMQSNAVRDIIQQHGYGLP
ncbi:MAG TPA: molybdate ABC transporter substrate-binding protein [Gammaproteobacteria bacterium]|jgi:molybdate transport system substrate-binding protein|nr:molybdate ABC transporter substrate-binding protein [Gammaproteobacteria bacterium]